MPGIDFALDLCRWAATQNYSVYLLGGTDEAVDGAAHFLRATIPGIAIKGARSGYFDVAKETEILADIKTKAPRLLLVALGMPRQDVWIYKNLDKLSPGLAIGVGGSFDVWAGHLERAPRWIQNLGLEWLYRLWQEPFRWRRIAQLPVFAMKVISAKSGKTPQIPA